MLVAATLVHRLRSTSPAPWTLPLKFLVPGTVFLIGVPADPGRLHDQRRVHELLDRAHPHEGPGDRRDQGQLARPADERRAVRDGARARLGRQARPRPRRPTRRQGATSARTKGLKPLAADRRAAGRRSAATAAKGYTLLKGAALFALDKELARYRVPPAGDAAIQPQGLDTAVELTPTLRYDAQHDPFTRITTARSSRTTASARSSAASGEELEPGWKTHVGFATSPRSSTTRCPQAVPAVFAWTFVFAALDRAVLVRARPLPRDRARQAGPALPALYRSVLSSPTPCRRSCRCSSGRAC